MIIRIGRNWGIAMWRAKKRKGIYPGFTFTKRELKDLAKLWRVCGVKAKGSMVPSYLGWLLANKIERRRYMFNIEEKKKVLMTYEDNAGRGYVIDNSGRVFELKDVGILVDGNKVFDCDGHLILIVRPKV